jgi:hypothetical protein
MRRRLTADLHVSPCLTIVALALSVLPFWHGAHRAYPWACKHTEWFPGNDSMERAAVPRVPNVELPINGHNGRSPLTLPTASCRRLTAAHGPSEGLPSIRRSESPEVVSIVNGTRFNLTIMGATGRIPAGLGPERVRGSSVFLGILRKEKNSVRFRRFHPWGMRGWLLSRLRPFMDFCDERTKNDALRK